MKSDIPKLHDGYLTGISIETNANVALSFREIGGKPWVCRLSGRVEFRCVDMGITNIVFDVEVQRAAEKHRAEIGWIREETGVDPARYERDSFHQEFVNRVIAGERWLVQVNSSQGALLSAVCERIEWEPVPE